MLKSITCGFCGKIAELKNEKTTINIEDEPIEVTQYFYRCESCKEEFTTTELDEATIKQIRNGI